MMVLRYGGVSNRPGTDFVSEVSDSLIAARLIPFVFNQDQTYVLEFGDYTMRVVRDGLLVTDTSDTITGVTLGATTTLTITGHGYQTGDEIYVNGVSGTLELNNRNFKVGFIDANNIYIRNMDYTDLDSSGYEAYVSGGTSYKVYEIETPYSAAQAREFKYVQSADVVTFAHPEFPPQELLRYGETNWVFQELSFVPTLDTPNSSSLNGGPAGSKNHKYIVTAVSADGVESLPARGLVLPGSVNSITQANPVVVTMSSAHSLESGEEIIMFSTPGMEELEGKYFKINVLNSTSFELRNVDGTNFGAYTGSGSINKAYYNLGGKGDPTEADPITYTYTAVNGAVEYNIYKEDNGSYSLLGITTALSFDDIGQTVDPEVTPPSARYPFLGTGNYPSTVTYIQQRLAFANTNNDTEKIFLSKTSDFKNYSTSRPLQSDDAITFQMVGRQVNAVKNLIDLGSLVIMTSSGEWSAQGNEAGVIEPTSINTKQYSYNGSGDLQPIIIDGAAIYQQARGSIIRDLGYDFQVDGYRGNDLTIFSAHLFDKYTIVDWAYQQIPHSILWVARSDGALLGLTFVRNQEIRAWHIHDMGGEVETVAVIPEGNEDFLYMTVKREVNGRSVRYIEKMSTRLINEIEDSKFMDSNLSYDGRNTGSTTMTLSGGTTWEYTETLTLTSSASVFKNTDIGNEVHFNDGNGVSLRFEIEGYTSDTVVTGKPKKTVPVALRGVSSTAWSRAVDELIGLWHLEGKDVSVFADGYVAASPNNESYEIVTVTNGKITLDKPYGVIHVGLPYLSDIETLDIDTSNGETISDKEKIVNRVNLFVEDTRGIWTGPKPPGDDLDDPVEGLTEVKIRNEEDYESPVSLKTDVVDVNIEAEWNSNGRIFVRQIDPIPLSVLAVSPAGKYPFS